MTQESACLVWFDNLFPYVMDPLHDHTYNSYYYYYHHVKHRHAEGNGPDDLSSPDHLQRDTVFEFLRYVSRFILLVCIELPTYFIRKGQWKDAREGPSYFASDEFLIHSGGQIKFRTTIFIFLLPCAFLRTGFMIGNWDQHALEDEVDPDSNFRCALESLRLQWWLLRVILFEPASALARAPRRVSAIEASVCV